MIDCRFLRYLDSLSFVYDIFFGGPDIHLDCLGDCAIEIESVVYHFLFPLLTNFCFFFVKVIHAPTSVLSARREHGFYLCFVKRARLDVEPLAFVLVADH